MTTVYKQNPIRVSQRLKNLRDALFSFRPFKISAFCGMRNMFSKKAIIPTNENAYVYIFL